LGGYTEPFLEHGADLGAKDENGLTPWGVTEENKYLALLAQWARRADSEEHLGITWAAET
jgi:hypothetical protein